jgi:hypothetical protein
MNQLLRHSALACCLSFACGIAPTGVPDAAISKVDAGVVPPDAGRTGTCSKWSEWYCQDDGLGDCNLQCNDDGALCVYCSPDCSRCTNGQGGAEACPSDVTAGLSGCAKCKALFENGCW